METNGKVIAQKNKGIYVNVSGYARWTFQWLHLPMQGSSTFKDSLFQHSLFNLGFFFFHRFLALIVQILDLKDVVFS